MGVNMTKAEILKLLEDLRSVVARLPSDAGIGDASTNAIFYDKQPAVFLRSGFKKFAEQENLKIFHTKAASPGVLRRHVKTAEGVIVYGYLYEDEVEAVDE